MPDELPALAGVAPSDDDAALRQALDAVEEGRSRPYYDADKDDRDRNTYYRAEIERGLGNPDADPDPGSAYTRLGNLLKQTHQTQLRYNPSKHVYPWVDQHPSRKL